MSLEYYCYVLPTADTYEKQHYNVYWPLDYIHLSYTRIIFYYVNTATEQEKTQQLHNFTLTS